MSRGSQEGEFAPNAGLKLPEVQAEIFHQVRQSAQEMGWQDFYREELEVIQRENSAVMAWREEFMRSLPIGEKSQFPVLTNLLYRYLRKQAEAQAMLTDTSAYNYPLLPRVLGEERHEVSPLTILPIDRARNPKFVDGVLDLLFHENPEIYNWIMHGISENDVDSVAAICGMYWLLKYHSKPREKKKL